MGNALSPSAERAAGNLCRFTSAARSFDNSNDYCCCTSGQTTREVPEYKKQSERPYTECLCFSNGSRADSINSFLKIWTVAYNDDDGRGVNKSTADSRPLNKTCLGLQFVPSRWLPLRGPALGALKSLKLENDKCHIVLLVYGVCLCCGASTAVSGQSRSRKYGADSSNTATGSGFTAVAAHIATECTPQSVRTPAHLGVHLPSGYLKLLQGKSNESNQPQVIPQQRQVREAVGIQQCSGKSTSITQMTALPGVVSLGHHQGKQDGSNNGGVFGTTYKLTYEIHVWEGREAPVLARAGAATTAAQLASALRMLCREGVTPGHIDASIRATPALATTTTIGSTHSVGATTLEKSSSAATFVPTNMGEALPPHNNKCSSLTTSSLQSCREPAVIRHNTVFLEAASSSSSSSLGGVTVQCRTGPPPHHHTVPRFLLTPRTVATAIAERSAAVNALAVSPRGLSCTYSRNLAAHRSTSVAKVTARAKYDQDGDAATTNPQSRITSDVVAASTATTAEAAAAVLALGSKRPKTELVTDPKSLDSESNTTAQIPQSNAPKPFPKPKKRIKENSTTTTTTVGKVNDVDGKREPLPGKSEKRKKRSHKDVVNNLQPGAKAIEIIDTYRLLQTEDKLRTSSKVGANSTNFDKISPPRTIVPRLQLSSLLNNENKAEEPPHHVPVDGPAAAGLGGESSDNDRYSSDDDCGFEPRLQLRKPNCRVPPLALKQPLQSWDGGGKKMAGPLSRLNKNSSSESGVACPPQQSSSSNAGFRQSKGVKLNYELESKGKSDSTLPQAFDSTLQELPQVTVVKPRVPPLLALNSLPKIGDHPKILSKKPAVPVIPPPVCDDAVQLKKENEDPAISRDEIIWRFCRRYQNTKSSPEKNDDDERDESCDYRTVSSEERVSRMNSPPLTMKQSSSSYRTHQNENLQQQQRRRSNSHREQTKTNPAGMVSVKNAAPLGSRSYREDYNEEANSKWHPVPSGADCLLAKYRSVCTEVIPNAGLYLSGYTVARDRDLLKELKITHIVNTAGDVCENAFAMEPDFRYISFILQDNRYASEDLQAVLGDILEYIHLALTGNRESRVLVHCKEGVSRSATIVIGYLMWRGRIPFTEALEILRLQRPMCNPNTGFTFALLRFQKFLGLSPSGMDETADKMTFDLSRSSFHVFELFERELRAQYASERHTREYVDCGSGKGEDHIVNALPAPFSVDGDAKRAALCGDTVRGKVVTKDNNNNNSGPDLMDIPAAYTARTAVKALSAAKKRFATLAAKFEHPEFAELANAAAGTDSEKRLFRISIHHSRAPFAIFLGVSFFERLQRTWMPAISPKGLDDRFFYILRDGKNVYLWRGKLALYTEFVLKFFETGYLRQLCLFERRHPNSLNIHFVNAGEESSEFWSTLYPSAKGATPWLTRSSTTPGPPNVQRDLDISFDNLRLHGMMNFTEYCRRMHSNRE